MPLPLSSIVQTYTQRFHVRKPYFTDQPAENLSLIIAIPAYKEPDITKTLQSLAACRAPSGVVEIIITINAPNDASTEILKINQQTIDQIRLWEKSKPGFLKLFVIREEHIDKKHAGAGMARKIGMDEAVQRWSAIDRDRPIICLDADCTVSENYLIEAEKTFADPSIRAAHFYFEHDQHREPDPKLRKGIMHYELHLRCYIQGLKAAGYPFAVHTVGSCMAVRASVYAKAGGMNKRKAGEDFYFLHKIVPHGGWQDIPGATVFPSCRASDRVPFGTGRAQLEWLSEDSAGQTYNAEIYQLLAPLFGYIARFDTQQPLDVSSFHPEIKKFLAIQQLDKHLDEMKRHASTSDTLRKRFWEWMDGFMMLKLVHHLRDHGFNDQPVLEAAKVLLQRSTLSADESLESMLQRFRLLDKYNENQNSIR